MMSSRIYSLAIISFLFLISCSPKEEPTYELELLSEVLGDMNDKNLRVIDRMSSTVEQQGKREYDVKVLYKATNIFDRRNEFKIPMNLDTELTIENFIQLDQYLSYLESIYENENVRTRNSDWEEHISAINYFKTRLKTEFNINQVLNILISVSYLERELLWDLASQVGGTHDFGIDFNHNMNKDTILLGEQFELIISPNEVSSDFVIKYDYASPTILLDQTNITNFDLKVIGSSAYLKFTPELPGVYHFKAMFTATFDHGEYVYDWPVTKDMVVLDP